MDSIAWAGDWGYVGKKALISIIHCAPFQKLPIISFSNKTSFNMWSPKQIIASSQTFQKKKHITPSLPFLGSSNSHYDNKHTISTLTLRCFQNGSPRQLPHRPVLFCPSIAACLKQKIDYVEGTTTYLGGATTLAHVRSELYANADIKYCVHASQRIWLCRTVIAGFQVFSGTWILYLVF